MLKLRREKDEKLAAMDAELQAVLEELAALREQLEDARAEHGANYGGSHKSLTELVDELRAMLRNAEDELPKG